MYLHYTIYTDASREDRGAPRGHPVSTIGFHILLLTLHVRITTAHAQSLIVTAPTRTCTKKKKAAPTIANFATIGRYANEQLWRCRLE